MLITPRDLADDPDALVVQAYLVLAGWHPPGDV
jgi:hypothetical protein